MLPNLSQRLELAAGQVRIDAGQDKIGPVLAQLCPEAAGLAPGGRIDAAAMLHVRLENIARFRRHLGIQNADEQLVIDAQAADIKVGRACIDDVVENEELGAQFADIRGGCEYMECLETIPETDARRLIDAEAKERREEERVDEWLESH